MSLIAKIVTRVAEKYPQHLPALMKELNVRMRTKIDDVKLLPGKLAEITASNPSTKAIVLSVIGGIIGNQALESIIDYFDRGDASGNRPEGVKKLAADEMKSAWEAVKSLTQKNSGDGDDSTMWDVPIEEVMDQYAQQMTAMSLISQIESTFGGVDNLEKVFIAFKSLEPEHFAMYRTQRKLYRGY